ncbi:MAG: 3-phosphoshikimate 1-carboxyvinyltransferase [Pseudonocardiaceae bacterium]|nr:3-phosphoshikimate 1-carboxyvinyltransferase [Pseudonocardiaceae bacterium]
MDTELARTWQAPLAAKPIEATVAVPGSKSITNRAFVLATLSNGPTLVREPLVSRDTNLMLDALRTLGADVDQRDNGDVRITPGMSGPTERHIDVGNAGTVARFTPLLAARCDANVRYDGDEAIRRRPIGPLLDAMRALGVPITDAGGGRLPCTVHGVGRLPGGRVELDSSASSQFLSALLLAAPASDGGITVDLTGGTPPSEPHIAMTVAMLREFGADLHTRTADGEFVVAQGELSCPEYVVDPDLSTAAPFLAGAAVAGGRLRLSGWPEHTTQPGARMREVLDDLGVHTELDSGGLVVTGNGRLRGAELDLRDVGELTPVIAAMLCFADGPSRISGVAHLRGHETDRLAALSTELSALGAGVRDTDDGLLIEPAPMHGGTFHTYADHRLVMAAAVIGLRVPGVLVEDPETVGKTFPEFVPVWLAMLE